MRPAPHRKALRNDAPNGGQPKGGQPKGPLQGVSQWTYKGWAAWVSNPAPWD